MIHQHWPPFIVPALVQLGAVIHIFYLVEQILQVSSLDLFFRVHFSIPPLWNPLFLPLPSLSPPPSFSALGSNWPQLENSSSQASWSSSSPWARCWSGSLPALLQLWLQALALSCPSNIQTLLGPFSPKTSTHSTRDLAVTINRVLGALFAHICIAFFLSLLSPELGCKESFFWYSSMYTPPRNHDPWVTFNSSITSSDH